MSAIQAIKPPESPPAQRVAAPQCFSIFIFSYFLSIRLKGRMEVINGIEYPLPPVKKTINYLWLPSGVPAGNSESQKWFHEGNHECRSGRWSSGVAARRPGGSFPEHFNFHFFLFLIHPTKGPDGGHKQH
ncbi:hypothetical protein [uncultured Dialister sp.]|uniref:hypothetical protein n=1 Tax=uncultured Dialister sp. TaxID=278064 RepID=UPI0025F475A2|nr:hypothetical protein [uncultured Dialister sp.]